MKKFFTLIAVAMIATGVSAQALTQKLEKNRILYFTSDTISADEYGTYSWSTAEVVAGLDAAGMLSDQDKATDWNHSFAFRKDYTDPETGFTVKKGYYRGMFIDSRFYFNQSKVDGSANHDGYTNLRKVILYCVGLPTAWLQTPSISYQDYPGGRVEAEYHSAADGSKISNNAYRELHISMDKKSVAEGGTAYIQPTTGELVYNLPNFMNYEMYASADGTSVNPLLVTCDQPFKLTVNLDNTIDVSKVDIETEIAKTPEGQEKGEWVNVMGDDVTEATIDYYFGDIKEQNPYVNEPDKIGTDCTTGRNCNKGTWSTKLPWSATQPISVCVKKRMVIVGAALITANAEAPYEHVNTCEFAPENVAADVKAKFFEGAGEAYGSNDDTKLIDAGTPYEGREFLRTDFTGPSTGIKEFVAKNVKSNRLYNTQGIEVSKNFHGVVISDGNKFVQ